MLKRSLIAVGTVVIVVLSGLALDGRLVSAIQLFSRERTVGPLEPIPGSTVRSRNIRTENGIGHGRARLITCDTHRSVRAVIDHYAGIARQNTARNLPVFVDPAAGRLAFYTEEGSFLSVLAFERPTGGTRYLLVGGTEKTGDLKFTGGDDRLVRKTVTGHPLRVRESVERKLVEEGWTAEPSEPNLGDGVLIMKKGNRVRVVRIAAATRRGQSTVTWMER